MRAVVTDELHVHGRYRQALYGLLPRFTAPCHGYANGCRCENCGDRQDRFRALVNGDPDMDRDAVPFGEAARLAAEDSVPAIRNQKRALRIVGTTAA